MRNFEEITIKQVQEGYLSGEFSCEELVKWYLERIEKFNFQGPELRAMITVNPNALEEARRMDEYVKEHHALILTFQLSQFLVDCNESLVFPILLQ